jgi:L-fuconolactonase
MQHIIDAHVHFLDVVRFTYPWLDRESAHHRCWMPADYAGASAGCGIGRLIVVEGAAHASFALEEAAWTVELARSPPDLQLDRIVKMPLVRGVRDNIQGQESGSCLRDSFVRGVRGAHERGLHFELCITHHQLGEALELVRRCPDGNFILDHCGKPAIREKLQEPWAALLLELAQFGNVYCKISGLVTEADWHEWREEDVLEYGAIAARAFGPDRILFGSDWPVNELAGGYARWMAAAQRLASGWTASERERFFWRNAERVYRLA